MVICGLKLSHDSTISLLDDDKLVFSIELEKVQNNPRHHIIEDISIVFDILFDHGCRINDVDIFSIDGWIGRKRGNLVVRNNEETLKLSVAAYNEWRNRCNVMKKFNFSGLRIENFKNIKYESFMHVAGHIMSTYSTSPFAKNNEDSFILVWDGGMYPRLYYFNARIKKFTNYGPLFYFGSNIYSIFSQHFGPFKLNHNVIKDELSIAGKVMAYIAYGSRNEDIINILKKIYYSYIGTTDITNIPIFPYKFAKIVRHTIAKNKFNDEDILASFHAFIEELLISSLTDKLKHIGLKGKGLCYGGGAALNIKWNSTLREKCNLTKLWICPFPNDSGSAIGAACCSRFSNTGQSFINWNIFSGPTFILNNTEKHWHSKEFNIDQLARLIQDEGEPIIFIQSRAELGPRALGNRSIIMSATKSENKDILNFIKYRESYRPIAPICLEEYAPLIFNPGYKDPYMLYEHKVRDEWRDKIPAICHIDGTARLQTVNKNENELLYNLLVSYYKISGIPVLCNTSANFKGSGFFPDLNSIIKWNRINYIWFENILYLNKRKYTESKN